jgi:hypothetical protein
VDDAVADAALRRVAGEPEGGLEGLGGGLLGVHVLAGVDRGVQGRLADAGELRVEVDVGGRVGERGGQVRRPLREAVPAGDLGQLRLVPPDEHRLEPDLRPVGQLDAALLADREDGADQVLPVAHAPRDAVHEDPECCHGGSFHRRCETS